MLLIRWRLMSLRTALFGIVMATASGAALADPTILSCNTSNPQNAPVTYMLNEAQGTVTVTLPAFEYPDGSGTVPERTYVVSAKFSPYVIIFSFRDQVPGQPNQRTDYNETINRTTGVITYDAAVYNGQNSEPHFPGTMTCQVGKPTRKF